MNKTIPVAVIAALLSLTSCGNKQKSQNAVSANAEAATLNAPEQVLEHIYALVVDSYSDEAQQADASSLEEYVTPEYRDLQEKAGNKAAERGEAGPVDWDVWTNAQDCQGLKLLGIRKVKDENDGVVMMVTLENCGNENNVYVKMTERGKRWLISDFLYEWSDSLCSTTASMEKWLNGK